MFQEVHARQESSIKVSISYVEIYNEMMYDLLATLPDQDTSSSLSANSLVIAEVSQWHNNVTIYGIIMVTG